MTPMDNGIHKWDCFILHLGITTPACFACHDVGEGDAPYKDFD